MKKLIVSLLVLTAMLSAAIVDANRAQKVAENYYKNYAPESAKSNTVKDVLTKEYMGQPTWYVIQFTEGFVIVSADDAVRPILGYSFDGYVDKDLYNMQNPFVHRFGFYDRQIVHDVRESGMKDVKAAAEWKEIETNSFAKASKAVVVDALSPYNWGQGWPWNDQCPSNAPVGCVATAMHIIMRTHMGPDRGYSSHTYYDAGTIAGQHTVDFSAQTYDWALIDHIMDSGDVVLQAEADELAKLSYHAGVAVEMDYEADGSGAYTFDVPDALETYFGFDASGTYASVGTVTDETTNATTMRANLDLGRPMELSGSDATYGGHAYVCDGYTDDYYYHFNWGWDGSANGWYKLNNLNTGGGDFTSSQGICYNLFVSGVMDSMPPADNLQGSLANGEDVTLTWDAPPTGPAYRTLTGYNVYRGGELVGSTAVATRTYDDNDLSKGNYIYTVKATYEYDGESFGTNAYDVTISIDENFPVVTGLGATTLGRTQIDLAWAAPITAQIHWQDDIEAMTFDADWTYKRTNENPPVGTKTSGVRDNFTKADVTDGWSQIDANSFTDGAQYIHAGTYSMGIGYTAPDFSWAISPSFNLPVGNKILSYWTWNTGNAGSGWLTNYYVYFYTGDFTESDPSTNLTLITSFIGIDENTGNTYTAAEEIPVTASGDMRLCYVYEYTDGYQMMIDDIVIMAAAKSSTPSVVEHKPLDYTPVREAVAGPVTINNFKDTPRSAPKADNPTSYDIYRNGVFATNIADPATLTWTDTAFDDGVNEYFIKTNYPTGTSIASDRDATMMYANPAPGFLSGVLLDSDTDVELNWFAPFEYPAHWFGFTDDGFESYFDMIDGMTGTWNRRRVTFTASGLGLGYAYPITVDSLAAAFYEDTATLAWTNSDFTFDIYTSNYAGDADSVLMAETGTLTAVSGYYTDYALPSTLTMNMGWYVCVNVNDNGTPSSFVNAGAGYDHSSVYYGGDGTYDPGWYTITYGDDPGDWAILCYGKPAVDTWFQNKEEAPVEQMTITPSKVIAGEVKPALEAPTSKALVTYHVWRDGVDIAQTTNQFYTDLDPGAATWEYYITAEYTSPVGNSDPCASVFMTTQGGGGPIIPAVPANVVTSIVGTDLQIDWDVSADATGYDVYASDDPYGTFTNVASVGTNQYTVAADQAKMFYQIIATNSTKAAPKTIEVAKPAKSVK